MAHGKRVVPVGMATPLGMAHNPLGARAETHSPVGPRVLNSTGGAFAKPGDRAATLGFERPFSPTPSESPPPEPDPWYAFCFCCCCKPKKRGARYESDAGPEAKT